MDSLSNNGLSRLSALFEKTLKKLTRDELKQVGAALQASMPAVVAELSQFAIAPETTEAGRRWAISELLKLQERVFKHDERRAVADAEKETARAKRTRAEADKLKEAARNREATLATRAAAKADRRKLEKLKKQLGN